MKERDLEDKILIQNILNGNKESEKQLYHKYRKILTCYLNKQYPKNNEVEDDVSEILIRVFLKLNTYNENISKFKTWVFSIAKNHMIDKTKTTCFIYSTGTVNIDDECDNYTTIMNLSCLNCVMSSNTTSPDIANFENQDVLSFVNSHINNSDFSFLNMHYSMGYSYCEIGREFNITSNTVSNRVNYIKSKLKNCTAEEFDFE